MEKSKTRTGTGRKTEITEEPKFFRVISAGELEGTACAHCRESFDPSVTWMKGYKAKISAYPMEKGDVYHRDCLRNYVLIVINVKHFFAS